MGKFFGLNIRSERYAAETSELFLLNEEGCNITANVGTR
jgi:hypothetical protein